MTSPLTVGSCFSGIGGLDRGLEDAGMTVLWQCENAPYPSKVLARHWPNVPNLGDITQVDWSTVERVDLICGGYPCPAFSQAARGRNTAPNLWPYMRDAIAVLQPRYVLIENVRAHLGRGFGSTLADLDALGFDAEWTVISACAVGASHRRERLFCLAHSNRDGEPAFALDDEVAWLSQDGGNGRAWPAAPARLGMAHGVPARLDRLRALGNAVVPQVAELIGARIASVLSA